MIITKDLLPQFERVHLCLYDCDEYKIRASNVLDIRFDEPQRQWIDGGFENLSPDGEMIVSKRVSRQLGRFARNRYEYGMKATDIEPEENYYFF